MAGTAGSSVVGQSSHYSAGWIAAVGAIFRMALVAVDYYSNC